MLFSLTTSELPSKLRWLPEGKAIFLRAQAVSGAEGLYDRTMACSGTPAAMGFCQAGLGSTRVFGVLWSCES